MLAYLTFLWNSLALDEADCCWQLLVRHLLLPGWQDPYGFHLQDVALEEVGTYS